MQIPEDILQRWSSFVTDWCLGVEPVEPSTAVNGAFCTLRRLWPEYVNDIQEQGARGIAVVASAVSLGLTLAACRPLKGFQPVMARVRQGENSALAELEFAAALVRSGLTPELEPQVRSRQLDCSVEVGSEIVLAEVITPETSEAIRDAYAAIERVALELVERSKGTHTEVLLTVEPDTKFDTIITSATATPPDETVHNVEGTGWVRRVSLASQAPEVAPQIPNPDPRPAVLRPALDRKMTQSRLLRFACQYWTSARIGSSQQNSITFHKRSGTFSSFA